MYQCTICKQSVGPKSPLRRHLIFRASPIHGRQEIAREIPVCDPCGGLLASKVPIAVLRKQGGKPIRA